MSTIVGLKDGNDVYIGADSRASTEDGHIRPIMCQKVFRNGKYLVGFTGSVRGGQVLFPHNFRFPKHIYLLPDAIREQLHNKGCLESSDTQTDAHGCNYLIATHGRLYEILCDFQLNQIEHFTSIGSGSPFAFGSLFTTSLMEHQLSPVERVELALKAAAEFDAATGSPFVIEKL
jgi:ATP-dependent protease HslVU (ClpYQ) peptidase subunit